MLNIIDNFTYCDGYIIIPVKWHFGAAFWRRLLSMGVLEELGALVLFRGKAQDMNFL